MNTLDEKKKNLELEQDPLIQPDSAEDDINIEDVEKYDGSFLDPSAEEIDMELDMVDILKNIDEE